MDPCMQSAMVFVGAVIGAGFASGREVVSFFSTYGLNSWWLILLSVCAMAMLCCLCMRSSSPVGQCHWCAMYDCDSPLIKGAAEGCILLLQIVMGGSMISAAGHLAALALPFRSAYLLGALGTMGLALALGAGSLKPMTVISAVLGLIFLLAVLAVLIFDRGELPPVSLQSKTVLETGWGAIRAVAYAALNLSVSIGVICRCGGCSCRISSRTAVWFGLMMTALLFVSNYLYLKHPELNEAVFPMVTLLSRFGRLGYAVSLLLMYLAVLTTLSAGLYALRTGFSARFSACGSWVLTALLPLAVSFVGFESIVDQWYAPFGLLCLGLVFGPLARRQRQKTS